MRAYLALFKNNMRLTLRDRGVLFFNYLFPLIFFFAFAELFHAGVGGGIAYFVSTVLVMGILGNGLWGAGMRSVQEREANILRRFKVTPISPLPILVAAMVSGWLLFVPVLILLVGLAHFIYAMPMPENWFSLFLMASLGVCSMRAIGLILAAVTNTMQETTIAIQILYMPMLFLSGATFPSAMLPKWAQTVAQFMPASYLVTGFQGIFFQHQNLLDNAPAVGALLATTVLGTFLAVQLFRWEKEETIRPRKKFWVAAVLAPFVVLGSWQAYSKEHIGTNQALYRQLQRSDRFVIRNTRIFTGDGKVIENGAVFVHDGKIAEIYEGTQPDAEQLKAEVIEGAGKTLLPGLIDTHVHLGASGAIGSVTGGAGGQATGGPATYGQATGGQATDGQATDGQATIQRSAAALLYSGITAARSTGDGLDASIKLRKTIHSGAKLGANLFVCGPMFTAEGGHGTEFVEHLPATIKSSAKAQLVRTPKTPEEARKQVRDLKAAGVDCVKAILEAGWGEGMRFDRLDLLLVRAVAEEAHAQHLPLATHTGDSRDVADAIEIGSASVEHGSWRDEMPDRLLERMARDGVYLDPTLGVAEAYSLFFAGKPDGLSSSLVQQVVSAQALKDTREFVGSGKSADPARAQQFQHALEQGRGNLLRAWKAGVPLVMGSDSGNPLVFHGPSLHHELQLWVEAGIPIPAALQAATVNAARLLGAEKRIGAIRKGMDADLLMVDGNPLQEIAATERISLVVLKGERIRRSTLFDQK